MQTIKAFVVSQRVHSILRRVLVLVGISALGFALLLGIIWITLVRPQFVELNIPLMEGMSSWGYVGHTVDNYQHDKVTYFRWTAITSCPDTACKSKKAIFEYFDGRLSNLGWEQDDARFCDSPFFNLTRSDGNKSGYITYTRQENINKGTCRGPLVCVATWKNGDSSLGFALISKNPSFFTNLDQCE